MDQRDELHDQLENLEAALAVFEQALAKRAGHPFARDLIALRMEAARQEVNAAVSIATKTPCYEPAAPGTRKRPLGPDEYQER